MPKGDTGPASRIVEVPIERLMDSHEMASLEEVWHHGRAAEDRTKAQILYAMAERGMVPVADLKVRWRLEVEVKAAQVPAEALEGYTDTPEALEARMAELGAMFRATHDRGPLWASTMQYSVPTSIST